MEEDEQKVPESVQKISGKWKLRVVYAFRDEGLRFTDIRKKVSDISNKVLSDTLNELVEMGLVKQQESVEGYKLTQKGVELRKALKPLGEWASKYSDSENHILIVEQDMDQALLYQNWLEGFETETCHPGDIFDNINDVSLVVIDRDIERSLDLILNRLEDMNIPVIMATGVEPGLDVIDLNIQNYLLKPITREELHEAVDKALKLANASEDEKKLEALKSKRDTVKKRYSEEDLENNEKYQEVLEKIERLS